MAVALQLQPATVREELSSPLVMLPEKLTAWRSNHDQSGIDSTDSPLPHKPYHFAPSAAWKSLVKRRVSSAVWAAIKAAIRRALVTKDKKDEERADVGRKRPRPEDNIRVNDVATREMTMRATTRETMTIMMAAVSRATQIHLNALLPRKMTRTEQ